MKKYPLKYIGEGDVAAIERDLTNRIREWQAEWCFHKASVTCKLLIRNSPIISFDCIDNAHSWGCSKTLGLAVIDTNENINWLDMITGHQADDLPHDGVRERLLEHAKRNLFHHILSVDIQSVLHSQDANMAKTVTAHVWCGIEVKIGTYNFQLILPQYVFTQVLTSKENTGIKLESVKTLTADMECQVQAGLQVGDISLSELNSLKVGKIIELNCNVDEPLHLTVNGKPIAKAYLGKLNAQKALVIDS